MSRRPNGSGTVALEFLRAVSLSRPGEDMPPGSASALDDLRDLIAERDMLRGVARRAVNFVNRLLNNNAIAKAHVGAADAIVTELLNALGREPR